MPSVLFVLLNVGLAVSQLCTVVGVPPPLVLLGVQGGDVGSCAAVVVPGVHSWFGGDVAHS